MKALRTQLFGQVSSNVPISTMVSFQSDHFLVKVKLMNPSTDPPRVLQCSECMDSMFELALSRKRGENGSYKIQNAKPINSP